MIINKKTIVIFTILITIINTLMPIANAVTEISSANLISDHKINSHIMYYNEEKEEWRKIQCNYICYKTNNTTYPAYCITHGVNGVDEEGAYTVSIEKLLEDQLVYNTILNGYPYKSPEYLGLDTVDEAYVATKHAVNSVLLNRDVKTFYKAVDAKGEKIIAAIYDIAERGRAGKATNKEPELSIEEVGNLIEYGDYYYQEYEVSANVSVPEYIVEKIENFPEGTYIADSNGNIRTFFRINEKFRIMIPKNELDKNIEGKINIGSECNTAPVFYGKAPKANTQDYAITYRHYVHAKASINFEKETNTSSIKIIKQDKENSTPIENVEFGLYNENDEFITSEKTNSDGILMFNKLYQGTHKVKELNANENYEKDETIYEISTEYNKEASRTITNTHKKGNLKIKKVDKDDTKITLGGIEFDLIDENKNTIAHLITDANGEAYVDNINIGKYTIKETKTNDNYNLCVDNNIEVKWNETIEITIENEKKKGQIQITKQDKENADIKLDGVEFQVIDSNNVILDEIKTDSNGTAITKRLPIGEYTIKEVSLGENNQYILEETEYKVIIENEEVTDLVIENMHKKGNLKITKVDKDDNTVTLGAIEFDLIDENKNTVEHLTTDANGEAYVENINTGEYTLKETKTKREYNLCENKDITVEWNKTTEITIENEKIKGQIEIHKTDKNNSNIKLSDVEFKILDINGETIEKIITDENGYAISKKIPMGEYYLKEIKTKSGYILNEETIKININGDKIIKLDINNEKIKGKIKIIKTSSNFSPILNINQGQSLEGVEFEIFDSNNELVDTIVTDETGQAISKNLDFGKYKIKEKSTKKYYILSRNEFSINIEKNNEVKVLEVKNEAVVPNLDVEISGQTVAERNEEIKYEFDIKNMSNSKLDNFTWTEYIPYEHSKITKMVTGIYNKDTDYEIYYKTNQNDYRLFKMVNSLTSEYLNFDELELFKNEIITEIKVEYKTVDEDFNAMVKPVVYTKINDNVKKNDKIVNNTNLYGNIEDYVVRDRSTFETIIFEKEIQKKLPKTGC